MPYLQRYPWNLDLIKNVVFIARKLKSFCFILINTGSLVVNFDIRGLKFPKVDYKIRKSVVSDFTDIFLGIFILLHHLIN